VRRAACLLALLVVAPALVLTAAAAEKKGRKVDLIWVAPDFAARHIRSVAMVPVATYDHNIQVEKLVAAMWSNSLKDAGYRWVSENSTRVMLQDEHGDSTVNALQASVLRNPRPDSLTVSALCARLRTSALLTMRVDRWEQQQIQWDQTGKPTTTVQLTAALVDSTGHLLWTASGSETGEGPYHDPSTNPLAVTQGGLSTQPVTGQGGPPAFNDVATRLFVRWATQFPAFSAATP
jgi:hypothetical protein